MFIFIFAAFWRNKVEYITVKNDWSDTALAAGCDTW